MSGSSLQSTIAPLGLAKAGLLCLLAATACTEPEQPRVTVHSAGADTEVSVELATDPQTRRRGLMRRESLGAREGMLFVFPEARERSFWMRNTPLPLDILFIDDDTRIVSVTRNAAPYSEEPIRSGLPVRYVLEVRAGFCELYGVRAGDRVSLPSPLPEGR